MKQFPLLIIVAVAVLLGARPAPEAEVSRVPLFTPRLTDVHAHGQTVEQVWQVTDDFGNTTVETNRYIQLGTSMNVFDETSGSWKPAHAEWEVTATGHFVARQTRHRVILSPSLADPDATDLLTPEGYRLQGRVLGIAALDRASGKQIMLAEVKPEARGEAVSPTKVVWADALEGWCAGDIEYEISLAGLEQNAVLRERIPRNVLEAAGLDPAFVVIQGPTEWTLRPEFTVERRVVKAEAAPDQRAGMAWPDLIEDDIGMGEMGFGPGRMLKTGAAEWAPMIKALEEFQGGRVCLVETVEWGLLEEFMKDLPEPAQASVQPEKPQPTSPGVARPLPAKRISRTARVEEAGAGGFDAKQRGLVSKGVARA